MTFSKLFRMYNDWRIDGTLTVYLPNKLEQELSIDYIYVNYGDYVVERFDSETVWFTGERKGNYMMQSIPNKDVLCKYTYLIKSLDREYLEITVYALSGAEAYDKLEESDIYRDYESISKCSKTVLIKAEIR